MDFGIFNLMQQRDSATDSSELVRQALKHTQIAEALGFSRAWFAEHHFSNYSLCPSPLMMIAHAAAVTKTIRLGSAVIVAPLHTPARLLGEIALADVLSNGRLDLGIGNGYQHFEFERFSMDLEERRARMLEMLDMIETGLSQESFEYQGHYYQQPGTAINVRCQQSPYPPIWLASGDHSVNGRSVRQGYIPFVSSRFASRDELLPIREHIADSYRREGKDPETMPLGVLSYGCVSENKADVNAYIEAARYQQRISRSLRERREMTSNDHWVIEQEASGEPSLQQIGENILAGDPETVAERLTDVARLIRPSHIMFYFQVGGYPSEKAICSMELLMERVIPMVEGELGQSLASINPL